MTIADKLITIADNTSAVAEAMNDSKTTATGSVFRVDDVLEDGQPLQIQLKNKNLFKVEDMCAANNSTASYDGDVITTTFATGQLYINKNRKVIYPAGTYTITVVPVSENVSLSVWTYDIDGTEKFIKSFSLISTPMSQTVTNDKDFAITIGGYGGSNGAGYGTHSFKVQIERGSVSTEYTPYVADFTGKEVKVYGKNLFNIDGREVRDFGALANTTQRTFTENSVYLNLALNNYCNNLHKMRYGRVSDSSFTILTPSNSAGGWEGYGAGFNFRVTPNTAYSVSASYDNTKGELAGCNFYDENGNYISNTTNTQNVKTPANCAWMNAIFRVRVRDEAVLYENIMLEIGSTTSEYTSYSEPQTATADASGKVNGLRPVVPSMTLVSDAWIECTYFPTSAAGKYEKYQQLKAAEIDLAESIKEDNP